MARRRRGLPPQVARVGVGEAVRLLARPREDALLLEPQLGSVRAERRQQPADRLAALGVDEPVARRLVDAERESLRLGQLAQLERRCIARDAPFQMRRAARPRQRPAGDERAAQVRATAAAARDDPRRHALDGSQAGAQDAGLVHRLQRARVVADDDQEARRALETVLAVGADLAGGAARAQELHGSARGQRGREVDVHLDRAAREQVERAGVTDDARELGQPAVPLRRQHLRELGADVFSERHGRCARAAGRRARARAPAPRDRGGSRPARRSGRPPRARRARPGERDRTRPGSSR